MQLSEAYIHRILLVFLAILCGSTVASLFDWVPSQYSLYTAWIQSVSLFILAALLVWIRVLRLRKYANPSVIGRALHLLGVLLFFVSCAILSVYSLRFSMFRISTPFSVTNMQFGFFSAGMIISVIAQLLFPEANGLMSQERNIHGWKRTITAALVSSLVIASIIYIWTIFSF
jgi:hypothetical protein